MCTNIYHGANPALTDIRLLRGRSNDLTELDGHIKERRSVVVMGVEGVGKSSLLNCYFNPTYRSNMAKTEKLLIRVTDFPTDRDVDGVYNYLADGVYYAVDSLNQESTKTIYDEMRDKCTRKREECKDPASRFQQLCEVISECGYHIMLVIDGFERFISSPNVTIEHHNLMNNLISKNMSFVVATNFDFNKTSLPTSISGSYLLQKFSDNELRLKGLSKEDCSLVLNEGGFSDEECHQLWILSGGIPALLRRAAEHTFSIRPTSKPEWKTVFNYTYNDVKPLLTRWCKLLSPHQISVLKTLAENDSKMGISFDNDTLRSAAQDLANRGLLVNPIEADTLREIPDRFKFNTPMLRQYCRETVLKSDPITIIPKTEITDDELLKDFHNWAINNGYTPSVTYDDEISNELLSQYQLDAQMYASYDETVQRFIHTGIVVDQILMGHKLLDCSPQFIEFAKALEAHLNITLLPLLKKICPNCQLKPGDPNATLGRADRIMLGQFLFAFNYRYRTDTFTGIAGDYCTGNGLTNYPKSWWDKLKKQLEDVGTLSTNRLSVSDLRNMMAHTEISEERGTALLRTMFSGNKSLFNRCQELYNELVERNII